MNPPAPAEYSHRAVFLAANKPESPVWFVLLIEAAPLDAAMLADTRDAITIGSHVLVAARSAAALDAATDALAELIQAPASIH